MGYIIKSANIESGEWIPAFDGFINCSNTTLQAALYSKIDNTVNCTLIATIDFTASINQSVLFTLPFNTSFSLANGSIGTFNAKGIVGMVISTGYPDKAQLLFTNTSLLGSLNGFFSASFMYKIQ